MCCTVNTFEAHSIYLPKCLLQSVKINVSLCSMFRLIPNRFGHVPKRSHKLTMARAVLANELRLQTKTLIVRRPFSPPCWQSCHPTASTSSVISAGHVCCQLRWLVTMESDRDRHLEPGHQGDMAIWVRIAGAMASNADLRRKCVCVFGRCNDAAACFHHRSPPIDIHKENTRGPACGECSLVCSSKHHLS